MVRVRLIITKSTRPVIIGPYCNLQYKTPQSSNFSPHLSSESEEDGSFVDVPGTARTHGTYSKPTFISPQGYIYIYSYMFGFRETGGKCDGEKSGEDFLGIQTEFKKYPNTFPSPLKCFIFLGRERIAS